MSTQDESRPEVQQRHSARTSLSPTFGARVTYADDVHALAVKGGVGRLDLYQGEATKPDLIAPDSFANDPITSDGKSLRSMYDVSRCA